MTCRLVLLTGFLASGVAACGGGGGGDDDGDDAVEIDAMPRTFCGDGLVDEGEECDDGDEDADDSCIDCVRATCGDGQVWTGVEECDDSTAGCVHCGTCTGTVDPATGHCYTIVATVQARAGAQASCAGSGAHLAAIDSEAEWTAIAALWTDPYPATWIGLVRAIDGMNVWKWETGFPLDAGALRWNATEPNDSGGIEDCVETGGAGGMWNDLSCTQTRRAMCEEPRWEIDPATNHAYRVFHRLRTHPEAQADCAALGAHLAAIRNGAEQAFVASIAPVNAWIGGFQGATENDWFWSTGEPFVFDAWGMNQPDDAGANEDCAQITATDGSWNDLACTSRIPYVCEAE
jgi:hypothetical protein